MIWWEKTVEYRFVIDYMSAESFALPFDGNHERLGDAIFSSDDKWILVEFKRSEKEIDSERKKFNDYNLAEEKLSGRDWFHFLVYGERHDSELLLDACNYFSKQRIEVSEIMNSGTDDPGEFYKYLVALYEEKADNVASSGEVEYGFVLGVQRDGSISHSISVVDYLKAVDELILARKMDKHRDYTHRPNIRPKF